MRDAGEFGGYEGSTRSNHFHFHRGYFGYPGRWFEGHGPRSDHGHAGDVRRYGIVATQPGHASAAFVPQRQFYRGGYGHPHRKLFHYNGEWDWPE
jgi:hypothetical protein